MITALNSMSPLAIIGLLCFIVWKQLENRKTMEKVQTNDLHELPEMAETLRRIEIAQSQSFALIIERLSNLRR